jgi:hypothetical protein
MSRVRAFARFWYGFIFGDDWLIAAGVAAAIGVTALLADGGVAAWWVMPLAVIALLVGSVRRGSRRAPRNESEVR